MSTKVGKEVIAMSWNICAWITHFMESNSRKSNQSKPFDQWNLNDILCSENVHRGPKVCKILLAVEYFSQVVLQLHNGRMRWTMTSVQLPVVGTRRREWLRCNSTGALWQMWKVLRFLSAPATPLPVVLASTLSNWRKIIE